MHQAADDEILETMADVGVKARFLEAITCGSKVRIINAGKSAISVVCAAASANESSMNQRRGA
jgi:hypothetical protein